jgi:hypothetical protein
MILDILKAPDVLKGRMALRMMLRVARKRMVLLEGWVVQTPQIGFLMVMGRLDWQIVSM